MHALFVGVAGALALLAASTSLTGPSQALTRPTAASQTFDAALSQAATLTRLRSLLVSVDGTLVLERYYRGASAARPANVKSVSKSIIALLVGIAVDRRQIASISDPISRYLPASSGATGDKGAMRIPAAPTTAPASIQFNSAIRSGEIPVTYAPASDSAVARVSRPNRVHR